MTGKINIFGDSHSQYFNLTHKVKFYDEALNNIKSKNVNLQVSHGASIRGLGRKKSQLNLNELVNSTASSECTNVFAFGQVDLELGYYFRRLFKNETKCIYLFASELVDKYFDFLSSLNLREEAYVIKGINLSVLKYRPFAINYVKKIIFENIANAEVPAYLSRLEEIYDPYIERQQAILEFNKQVSNRCQALSYKYYDINSLITKKGTLDIEEQYVPAIFDHHLCDSITIRKAYWNGLVNCIN